MKIAITFHLTVEDRQAIADYYGLLKPAGHEDCKQFIKSMVFADIEEISSGFTPEEEEPVNKESPYK